ncbi:MAG: ABC-2 type transport system ATP-binding protein [Planctomycetota bacterium]|jgi:ABC-2 type transport system ATP-binding protein
MDSSALNGQHAAMPVLQVDALRKRYGHVVAVDGVDLTVKEGEVHGLLGPNGSGKTTTLSCCLGLLKATSGTIEVLGEPASELYRTNGRVGVVFDSPHLLVGRTVSTNLAYAARVRGHTGGRTHLDALQRVGLTGFEERRAGSLSLGQRKRLSIAIALAGSPEFLVLDEPLSGLDPMGVREILSLVRELAREGLSILLSTHRLLDVESVLDSASILLAGKVAKSGPLDELLKTGGRCRVRVDDVSIARKALGGVGFGATVTATEAQTGPGELIIEATDLDPAQVARALVEGGVGLLSLESARPTLATLFEDLVDAGAQVQA